ncbi:MAG: prenyltransferase/squalene oxidase repeat-containing protein, partial [Pirellulales bacterium]
MAEAPTSTLLAQAEDAAIATGVASPSDIEATASAAQRDASAAETESTVTADAGSTDFDTGPTQLASEFNTGRAAGGGEPELHQATQSPRASRLASAGGAQVAAINAEVVAAKVAEAETADGGGQPDMAATETEVATVSRTADSATAAAEQTEVAAETTAASEVVGGAPQLAAARAPRSTAAVAFSGASAGGGTTQPLRQPAVNFTANTRADVPSPETAIAGAGNTKPESVQVAAGPVARQQPRQGANTGAAPQLTADVADAGGANAATASTQVAATAARERAAAAQPRSSASTRAGRGPLAAGAAPAAASTQVQIPASSTGESASPSDSAAATSEGVVAKITRTRSSAAADGEAGAPAAVAAAVGATTAAANSGVASPASAARGRPTPDAVAFAAASAGTSAGPARPLRTVVASGGPSVPIAVPSAVVAAVGDQGESAPVEVEKTGVARTNGRLGVEGAPVNQPTGAAEGEVALDAKNFAASGLQPGARPEAEAGGQPGPDAARAGGGAPFKISRQAAIPGVTRIVIEEDDVATGGPEFTTGDPPMQFGGGEGAVARRETGGAQSLVGARPGDGGLGDQSAAEAGSTSRKSQTQSDVVALATDVRFQQRDIGGPKFSGNTHARDTGGAFEGRKRRFGVDGHLGSLPNVGPEIMSGLEFLRRHQSDDGSWSFNNLGVGRDGYANERAAIRSDTAATGLCLMCYLGAGYDHFDFGGEYTQEIQGALKWLLDHQREDGNLYVDLDPQSSASAALYSHAIATMALCEAYGMTKDPKIRAAAQKAIEFIEATQHPDRGGWRYVPGKSSDLSVTG